MTGRPLLLALLLALPFPASAQTLVGRVLDEARESPVPGAVVRLLDKDGKERAQTMADSTGRFVLAPPKTGDYYLEATRLGYQRTVSPLLAMVKQDGTAVLDLMMAPAPIGLEGFSVEVDVETRATEDLRISGIRPADLGNRWVSRRDIEAVPFKNDVGRVLERQNIAGIRIIRPENLTPGSANLGLCVSMIRARTGSGMGRCGMVVLDGVPIPNQVALQVDPETVEGMALLLPTEATLLYGVRGEAGVLMIWTQRGVAR